MSQYRQLVSAGGIAEDDEGGYWDGLFLAIKEPFTWMFVVLHFGVIMSQSFKDFFPSVRIFCYDSPGAYADAK